MKRTIFLLTLLTAVTMSAKAYVPGDRIYLDGIEYYVEFPPSEGVRVCGFSYGGDGGGITNVVIPETVYGYRVTSIGNGAFKEKTGIRTVKLPAGINSIGGSAFEDCSNLTEVTLPAGIEITEIEDYTFSGCTSLTEITIPDGVNSIGAYAFMNCTSLTEITIPHSVLRIGEIINYYNEGHTFDGCNNLERINISDLSAWCNIDFSPYGSVYSNPLASNENARLYLNGELITDLVIPEDVTEVKPGAFNFYKGLKSVTVHPGLAKIGEKSFNWCDNLEAVHISDLSAWCRIDFDDDSANPVHSAHNLYLNGELVTDLVIPDGITEVKDYAFYGCSGLTSVTIPEGVTSIETTAFSYCSGLTSVTIPQSMASIGVYAFYECDNLNAVNITDLSAWCRIDFDYKTANPLYYAHSLYLNGGLVTDLIIPDDITEVKDYAFYGCSGLTSVTIPESVTSIGNSAFRDCSGLTSVIIPEGVTSIGSYAFSGCSGLTSVTIPEGVTSIGGCAFWDCSGLTSVIIPEGVTSIGDSAFSYCSGLTSVTIPESVTSIGNSAFRDCSGLTSIVLGDGIEEFGGNSYDNAFYGCDISEIILLDDSFEYLNQIEGIADGANVYGFIYGADAPSGVRYRQLELDIPDYTYTGHGPEYISVLENTSSYRIECTGVDGDESIDVGSHDATTAEVCI